MSRKRQYVEIKGKRIPKRRAEIFLYIVEYKSSTEHEGNNPSYQAIADHFGLAVSYIWEQVNLLCLIDGLITFTSAREFKLNGRYEPPDYAL